MVPSGRKLTIPLRAAYTITLALMQKRSPTLTADDELEEAGP